MIKRFSINILIVAFFSMLLFLVLSNIDIEKKNRLNNYKNRVYSIEKNINSEIMLINSFIRFDLISDSFYLNKDSKITNKIEENYKDFSQKIAEIHSLKHTRQFNLSSSLSQLQQIRDNEHLLFDSLLFLTSSRGFKDYGKEGEMRLHAHKLEQISAFDKTKLLMLRRHEKDYMIRNQEEYIFKFNALSQNILDNLPTSPFTYSEKNEIRYHLSKYVEAFNALVTLDAFIGIRSNSGLYARILDNFHQLQTTIDSITEETNYRNEKMTSDLNKNYLFFSILIIAFSIGLSFFISVRITKPLAGIIQKINENITFVSEPNLKKIDVVSVHNEINMIPKAFNALIDKLNDIHAIQHETTYQLLTSMNRFKNLVQLLPLGVFETDNDGKLSFVSEIMCSYFQMSKEELQQLRLSDLLVDNDNQSENCLFKNYRKEYMIAKRKDGTVFYVQLFLSRNNLKISKNVKGVIIDSTEKVNVIKQLEIEKEKACVADNLKSAFLANMSHEIRTPMNAIIGFTEVLFSEDPDKEERIEYLGIIKKNSEALMEILDDIIDISKIEANQLGFKNAGFDLLELLNEIYTSSKIIAVTSGKSNLAIELVNFEPLNKIRLFADRYRLRQVLLNLISNAIKFTEKGKIEIILLSVDRNIELCVKDTGIGIEKERQVQIFNRFFKIEGNSKNVYKGTGLGLYITKSIINQMGGEVKVKSQANKGSEFYICLPKTLIEEIEYSIVVNENA
jgi:PAS domain S-box-containing protein